MVGYIHCSVEDVQRLAGDPLYFGVEDKEKQSEVLAENYGQEYPIFTVSQMKVSLARLWFTSKYVSI